MAKRFTDTDKWDRPWFRKLPHPYRSFWLYILDKCDCAGIWYVDMEMASFMIGELLDYEKSKALFSKQIECFDKDSRWLIKDFIPFQYGQLSVDCKPHKPVFAVLKKFGLERLSKGYAKGINTLQEKEQEQDVSKEGGVGETKEAGPTPEDLVKLWNKEAHPSLPRVKFLTDVRKRHAQARLEANPDQSFWEQVLSKVNFSPLLRGDQGGWKASFDWILNPSNLVKIIEGNYDPEKRR